MGDSPKGCLSRHRSNACPLQEISSCPHLKGVAPFSGRSDRLSLDLFPPPESPMTLKSDLCLIFVRALAQMQRLIQEAKL